MAISRLSKEQLSLYYYLKYEVISPAFAENVTNDSLEYDASLGGYVAQATGVEPSPTSEGRGWVFFDDTLVGDKYVVDTSAEQTSKVSVTGASSYTVDYVRGVIKNPDATPTSVSYYWNYVSVLKYWPGVTPPPLPFVTISIESTTKEGFQLGGGVKNIRRVYIDIFATNTLERDDLTDTIQTALFDRTIAIKDFSTGSYLKYDGTFDTSLSLPLDSLGYMYMMDAEARNVHISSDWTEINKYRSTISSMYESFVEPS